MFVLLNEARWKVDNSINTRDSVKINYRISMNKLMIMITYIIAFR